MAALTGLAAARSVGEYCSACNSAAAPCSELITNWSPALTAPESVTPRPCAEKTLATVTGGSAEPSKLKTLPSEWRVTEPASPAVKLMV